MGSLCNPTKKEVYTCYRAIRDGVPGASTYAKDYPFGKFLDRERCGFSYGVAMGTRSKDEKFLCISK